MTSSSCLPSEAQPIISVQSLSKTFVRLVKRPSDGFLKQLIFRESEQVQALKNISFEIYKGECVGILGPNGAGKSTLLKILMGVLAPSTGTQQILKKDPLQDRKQLCASLGVMLGHRSHLIDSLGAIESLRYLGHMYNMGSHEIKQRIMDLAEVFEVMPYLDVPVCKLSLGERMRCELIASVLHRPKILFLDEPTLGLDVAAKIRFRKFLTKIKQQEKTTIILTSHDVGDLDVCDRIFLINRGMLVKSDSLNAFRNDQQRYEVVATYRSSVEDSLLTQFRQIYKENNLLCGPDGLTVKTQVNTSQLTKILTTLISWPFLENIQIEQESLEYILERLYTQTNYQKENNQ